MNINTKRGPVVLVDQAPCVIRPHIPTGERAVQSKFLHLLRDFSQWAILRHISVLTTAKAISLFKLAVPQSGRARAPLLRDASSAVTASRNQKDRPKKGPVSRFQRVHFALLRLTRY